MKTEPKQSDSEAQLLALNQEVAAKIEKGEPVTAPGVPKQCAGNLCDPMLESTVESFAWDTVKRVRRLAELSKKYPEQAGNVARQILAWPVMSTMPCLSEEDVS